MGADGADDTAHKLFLSIRLKKTDADGSRAAPSASDYKPPPVSENSKMPSEGLGLLKKGRDFPA
ncbi:hypothetical protein [Neisseria gonorrhoeae]|uniref:hypothetical protein n=1 Tax=Neisseria gonorrhoeae TaxID=485 RepID=UPI0001BD8296|nr:hypothetical protein [Neisseria gonorrhoeae]EEZ53827.1 predicted protein [Neisseria gonorrhoeae PID332]KLR81432.1 hypothetical protein M680_06335 [Neisseria gonorrhoeae SK8976]KLR98173.1 hypothetical protein M674_10190 [Neisseria gonorrhoeae SK708]UXY77707.1 hypothetical protein OCL46_10995 [Neisseria gonorrhoeae]UYA82164.1 hypothetical protein LLE35_10900 [Neisseria gonorrhoeae]